MAECLSQHQDHFRICRFEWADFVPYRLLYLEDLMASDSFIKLYEAGKQHDVQWCALSYYWGDIQPLQNTTLTYHKMLDRIALADLPKTFRDAALVSQRLGIQYLWVDALCIVQNNIQEVAARIMELPKIFRLARLVICATSAKKLP